MCYFDFVRVANLLNKDSVTIDDYNQYGEFSCHYFDTTL